MEEAEYVKQQKVSSYDLPVFLNYLRDARSIPLSEHITSNFKQLIEQMYPDLDLEKYHFENLEKTLTYFIQEITKVTKTDYNQIILKGRSNSHSDAKFVVADMISLHKQHYCQVAIDSEISYSIDYKKLTNLNDVRDSSKYMLAVPQTKSELIVPIIVNDICVGAINSESEEYGHYSDEIVSQITNISELFAISLSFLDFHVDMKKSELPYISLPC